MGSGGSDTEQWDRRTALIVFLLAVATPIIIAIIAVLLVTRL